MYLVKKNRQIYLRKSQNTAHSRGRDKIKEIKNTAYSTGIDRMKERRIYKKMYILERQIDIKYLNFRETDKERERDRKIYREREKEGGGGDNARKQNIKRQ